MNAVSQFGNSRFIHWDFPGTVHNASCERFYFCRIWNTLVEAFQRQKNECSCSTQRPWNAKNFMSQERITFFGTKPWFFNTVSSLSQVNKWQVLCFEEKKMTTNNKRCQCVLFADNLDYYIDTELRNCVLFAFLVSVIWR